MQNLVGLNPASILLHGPTKLLIDAYHWHEPDYGIVASYTPTQDDVRDHFGLFRGVDQIEAFAQATVGSCCPFLECRKHGLNTQQIHDQFIPAFISIGGVVFHHPLSEGETFVSIGRITFYKFRQMVCEGRIYKVPGGLDLDGYFADFNPVRAAKFDLSDDFTLVAELSEITGRAIKKDR